VISEIDLYINTFPKNVQEKLLELHQYIRILIPEAEDVIAYKMPAFKQNKILVYYAGYKNHIGFYPTASGIENFKHEFTGFKYSKGAIQFPIDKPLPLDLIKKIVLFRKEEDLKK